MDPTQVNITLAFTEIKGLCEHIVRMKDTPGLTEPGEVMLAEHILTVIERNFEEEKS